METVFIDSREMPDSCGDPLSRATLEQALALMLASRSGVMELIDGVLERDPECAMAHGLRAAVHVLGSDDRSSQELERSVRAIESLAGASDRERRHADAARAWLEGRPAAALARYGEILIDYPRDVLALLVAHALDFRLGRRDMLRDRPAEVLPHWHAGIPGYGYVLGMYAFGLEETGDYAGAEATARRALEIAPDNCAAVHVVAHVMEMQGRPREGLAWLDATRDVWEGETGFAVHLAWHRALFHLDLDEPDEALAIYDVRVRPDGKSPTPTLIDASALLWRLQLRGTAVGPRWPALAACWKGKRLAGARAFNLTHATMAFAAAGNVDEAARLIAYLERDRATRSVNTADDLLIARPVCEALVSFAQADYTRAVERLDLVRHLATRCGGSVAQCDLIHLTLVEAALRGRRARFAHALAAERSARKPGSRINSALIARAREALASAGTAGVRELAYV